MSRRASAWGWLSLFVLVTILLAAPAAAQDAATGTIRGTVVDRSTGEPAPGATIVATSPGLAGEQVVISDEAGAYVISNLPPGTYELTVYYGDLTVKRGGVVVVAGATAMVALKVDTSAVAGELITISDSAPTVDAEYTRSIPVPGRTFESVLGAAAGSTGDGHGVGFSGSSSLESTYVVDGVGIGGQVQRNPGRLTATTVPDADRFAAYLEFLGRHVDERTASDLTMDRRLRVRVVDPAGTPINDALVALRSTRGRTHADGIWDYFPSVDGADDGHNLTVTVSAGGAQAVVDVRSPARGTEEITVTLPVTAARPLALDLAFALDVTGSMADEMTYLQTELLDVIRRIRAEVPGVSIRLGAVAYRDRGDSVPLARRPFDEDVGAFMQWLDTLRADGGGDYPEDVELALGDALTGLQWRTGNAARIIVLLGDAPPQRYPDATYRIRDAMRDARTGGIRILPVAASGADRSVEYLWRALGAYTSTPYVTLTDHSGIGNDHLEADTDEIHVERFNDCLVRLVVEDLRGQGMHAPGNWRAWDDYRSAPWAGKPRRLVAGLGTGIALLAEHTDLVAMHWARAGIAFGDLELRVQLGWSSQLDGEPTHLARTARSAPGETPQPAAPRSLGLVPGAGVRYLFGPWRRLRAFTGAALEAQFLRSQPGAGVATLFSSQAGFELRSLSAGGLAAGVQLGGHVMLRGHPDLATPRPHLDLTLYAEHRF
jgi:hypothetical protein